MNGSLYVLHECKCRPAYDDIVGTKIFMFWHFEPNIIIVGNCINNTTITPLKIKGVQILSV